MLVQKNVRRDISLLDEARLFENTIPLWISLCIKIITTNHITHMHVYNSPRRQDCFLCWIFKAVKYLSYTYYTLCWH